jgi:hypothetical protein
MLPIEITCVDDNATFYATFQSHNQKIVSNRHGLFMTHIRTRNEAYTAQTWRLSRSVDGGRTFTPLHEDTHATNPPVLETDAAGNLYLVRPDFADNHAYLYRFHAARDFRDPDVTVIPNAAAGKYAMALDAPRDRLCFFSHNNTFHLLGLDGRLLRSVPLLRPGPSALLQYPLLSLDRDGALHAAWTTQKHDVYLYWDIHHMLSPDGGDTWRNLDGAPLALPVTADQTGPATRITPDDEFDSHTWLSNFMAKDGKLHFLYLAQTQPPRQHYVRYDIATGRRDIDRTELRGETLRLSGMDGFFASRDDRPGSPLYCVLPEGGRIACLVSRDNGDTWRDHARSAETFHIYSLGGCRQVTDDGWIVGTFTDLTGTSDKPPRPPRVFFFKIPA